jgi:hypothetical protein
MALTFLIGGVKALAPASASELTAGAVLTYALELGCIFLLLSQGARDVCARASDTSSQQDVTAGEPKSNTKLARKAGEP